MTSRKGYFRDSVRAVLEGERPIHLTAEEHTAQLSQRDAGVARREALREASAARRAALREASRMRHDAIRDAMRTRRDMMRRAYRVHRHAWWD